VLRSYFAAAIRNLFRNRAYAAINLCGLALGFIAAILIALFVRDEYSYDRFFPDYQRIYRVSETVQFPNRSPMYRSMTFSYVAAALRREFPEVQIATRLIPTRAVLRHGDVQSITYVHWADPDFFRVFPFKTLSGNLAQALSRPDGIVLTRAAARQFFGHDDVTGETLDLDYVTGEALSPHHEHAMRVTAVIEDLPSNTHLSVKVIVSALAAFSRLTYLDALAQKPEAIRTEDVYTYVKLYPGARLEKLNAAMRAFADRYVTGEIAGIPVSRFRAFSLIPIPDIHLRSRSTDEMKPTGDPRTLHAMIGIALLIMIVAASNFASMMTARAARRAVEVAVRKAVGATRSQLVVQFLGECLFYAVLALALASIAVELMMPAFNAFLQRNIVFEYVRDPTLGAALVTTAVITGLAAGAYPALLLSMFRPGTVLKGVVLLPGGGPARLRQLLVIFQFGTLIALIVSTLTMHRQTHYALEDRLRLPTDQIYLVNAGCRLGFEEAVARLQGVRIAACASDSAMAFAHIGTTFAAHERDRVPFRLAPVGDADFFRGFGVAPLAGRLFAADRAEDNILRENVASNSNPSVVINETGARALGYAAAGAAVGHFASWNRIELIDKVPRGFDNLSSQIIGVVPDFSIGSVRDVIEPTVYYIDPSLADDLILTLDGHAIAQTLRAVRELWAKHSEMVPLEGVFMSQYVNDLYANILRQLTLFSAFSAVAVVIAALGLLGLAMFTAERRTREIGLRKVMGASRADILRFLGWEFTRPVLWANVVAWPVAYVFMRRWLDGFAYHVDISPLVFVAASGLALIIAVSTVAGHVFLVARSKPVEALRFE
jgi:putative ABC transport system permease protein